MARPIVAITCAAHGDLQHEVASCAVFNRGDGAEAVEPQLAKLCADQDSLSVSFWFDEPPLQAMPRAIPLTSFQRACSLMTLIFRTWLFRIWAYAQVQLAREAERMLLLVLGTSRCI